MKRILPVVLVLLLCAAMLPVGALAASAKTVYISSTGSGSLNLRGGPGKEYAPVGYVYHGDRVTPGKTSGEWTRVKVAGTGAVGWIKTKYFDGTTKALGTGTWKVTAASAVNLRSGPGTGYSVRGRAWPGDRVKVLNTEDDWIRVTVQGSGLTGWMKASAIGKAASPARTAAPAAAPVEQQVRSVATDSLNVRSGPGAGYALVGTLDWGEALRVQGKSGSWLRVVARNGVSGWVASGYTREGSEVTVDAERLNVRRSPSGSAQKVGALLDGDVCTVMSVTSDGWAKVSCDFIDGYVSLKYLIF